MDKLRLVPPAMADAPAIAEYRAAFPAARLQVTLDPERIPGLDHLEQYGDVPTWLRFCKRMAGKISWFMCVREGDGRIVGFVCIRHALEYDDDDIEFASHIGYSIRPDERGKGYGTRQLRLALEAARAIGLEGVRVVCRDINTGSNKVIRANGGIYVDSIRGEASGLTINRYDIPLA